MKLYELTVLLEKRQPLKIQIRHENKITTCTAETIPKNLLPLKVLLIAPEGSFLLIGIERG